MYINQIQYNTYFTSRFDKKGKKQYNEPVLHNNFRESRRQKQYIPAKRAELPGYFAFKVGVMKMYADFDTERELLKFNKSEKLNSSPVAFLVPLVSGFLRDEIPQDRFKKLFTEETQNARFSFSYMPADEIKNNKRIYANELVLADSLYNSVVADDGSKTIEFPLLKDRVRLAVYYYNRNK